MNGMLQADDAVLDVAPRLDRLLVQQDATLERRTEKEIKWDPGWILLDLPATFSWFHPVLRYFTGFYFSIYPVFYYFFVYSISY